jgi:hypothetical protein
MRHQNSVFHSLLKQIPWAEFERFVEKHDSDARVRRLTTKGQFVALLYGQFSGAASLREIVTGLESHAAQLYHLGIDRVRRSTLADANMPRPAAVFSELFNQLVERTHRGLRRAMAGTTYLIDATIVPLSALCADWARFSANSYGAKAHLIYDPDADCPVFFSVTAANVPDVVAGKAMPIVAGATYVFDKGYYDYGWWATLDAAGCRFVTRLKANTPFTVERERFLEPGGTILSDRIGRLPARLAASRRNPMSKLVRVIEVVIETGKVLRILTNDLDASAQTIAELYKRRWAIELFFRWVKQTLKIRHFLGTSENAVRIQISIALIAFLLLRLAQQALKTIPSPLTFARLVRANLMHRRALDRLLAPPSEPLTDTTQLAIQWI